jgi:hypothetical protein
MAMEVTRLELSAEELRGVARRSKDSDQARRLLAIALVLEGTSRTEAARITGMDRQTLRDWVILSRRMPRSTESFRLHIRAVIRYGLNNKK